MSWLKRVLGRSDSPQPPQSPQPGAPVASAEQLKYAMTTVANRDTPHNRKALYETMLRAELILPTPTHDAPAELEHRVAGADEKIHLAVIKDDEGKTVWPAFTDEQALLAWQPQGAGYVQMAARAVFQMMINSDADRIAVNPGSAPAGFVTRYEATVLASGNVPVPESQQATRIHLQEDTKVLIGAPDPPPAQALVDRIREQAARYEVIESAYLFAMAMAGQSPHLVIGLRLRQRAEERAFAEMSSAIGTAAVAELPKDQFLDLLALDDEMHQSVRNIAPAIFTREHA